MDKKKYIEKEAVIRLIKTEGFNEKYDLGHPKDNAWFCAEVNRIHAADVVEVRHGQWIGRRSIADPYIKCSLCGQLKPILLGNFKFNYCPNCGAKMDGGGDND